MYYRSECLAFYTGSEIVQLAWEDSLHVFQACLSCKSYLLTIASLSLSLYIYIWSSKASFLLASPPAQGISMEEFLDLWPLLPFLHCSLFLLIFLFTFIFLLSIYPTIHGNEAKGINYFLNFVILLSLCLCLSFIHILVRTLSQTTLVILIVLEI